MSSFDLPLAKRWLAQPHVREWWGDSEEQFALVSGDLESGSLDQYIVDHCGCPFAYLQCYEQAAWPDNGLGAHPTHTRGIDQFIGEPDMVDRGHGSAFIRQFVDALLESGTPRVLTDPDPANRRAVRAYENAGFCIDRELRTPDGLALLMIRDNPSRAASA
jgi:aminoglycoside 6'-N-acetyltransferase